MAYGSLTFPRIKWKQLVKKKIKLKKFLKSTVKITYNYEI